MTVPYPYDGQNIVLINYQFVFSVHGIQSMLHNKRRNIQNAKSGTGIEFSLYAGCE